MKTTTKTPGELLQAASDRVHAVEAANMSASTIARAYRALFAAQDAVKAAGSWS